MPKIVGTDNLARETVADTLWLDGVPDTPECRALAQRVCDRLNRGLGDHPGTFYVVAEDDRPLGCGMEELV